MPRISVSSHACLKLFYKIFTNCFFIFFYVPKVFLIETLMFFAGCFLVARTVFLFRRKTLWLYTDAQFYTDNMHGLCRLPSDVIKVSLVLCR